MEEIKKTDKYVTLYINEKALPTYVEAHHITSNDMTGCAAAFMMLFRTYCPKSETEKLIEFIRECNNIINDNDCLEVEDITEEFES